MFNCMSYTYSSDKKKINFHNFPLQIEQNGAQLKGGKCLPFPILQIHKCTIFKMQRILRRLVVTNGQTERRMILYGFRLFFLMYGTLKIG